MWEALQVLSQETTTDRRGAVDGGNMCPSPWEGEGSNVSDDVTDLR